MRKRSSYRPKKNLQDPLSWVLNGFKRVADADDTVTTLRIKNHMAMKAMCAGTATFQDVDTLAAALNITEALEKLGVSNGWAAEIREGHQAIANANKRSKFLFTGAEMTAVNLAMEIHDAQIEKCTVGQLDDAVQIVKEIIRLKKASVLNSKQLQAA